MLDEKVICHWVIMKIFIIGLVRKLLAGDLRNLSFNLLLVLLLFQKARCSQTLLLFLVFFRRTVGWSILLRFGKKNSNEKFKVLNFKWILTSLLLWENVLKFCVSEWSPFWTFSPENKLKTCLRIKPLLCSHLLEMTIVTQIGLSKCLELRMGVKRGDLYAFSLVKEVKL